MSQVQLYNTCQLHALRKMQYDFRASLHLWVAEGKRGDETSFDWRPPWPFCDHFRFAILLWLSAGGTHKRIKGLNSARYQTGDESAADKEARLVVPEIGGALVAR